MPWVELLAKIGQFIVDATVKWMEFEDRVFRGLRQVGYTGEQLSAINNQLIKDTMALASQYGVTQEELLKIQQAYNSITKSAAILDSQTIETQVALGKLVGESNVSNWEESMHKFGMHAKSAQAWLGKGQIEAKKLGLNVEEYTSALARSANLMQKMTFQKGIDGLQKMVGLATKLGTSLETLTAHIDIDNGAFSTIEKSIETSAKLQRLGGSFAAEFSNPMVAMAEGMFDAEAAVERVVRSISGKGTFDRKTGQVDMGWVDKKTIGLAAEALGMDSKELRTASNRQTLSDEIKKDLIKSGKGNLFDEDQLSALTNLAQYDADKQKFEVRYVDNNGDMQTKTIDQLTAADLKEITKLTKEEEDINKNVASIAGKVGVIADLMQGKARDVTSAQETVKGAKETIDASKAGIVEATGIGGAIETVKGWVHDAANWVSGLFGHENGGVVQSSPTGLEGITKFANGGVATKVLGDIATVPGNDTTGDKVLTRVNSGEMILNKKQQSKLFSILDSSPKFEDGGIVSSNSGNIPKFEDGGVVIPKTDVSNVRGARNAAIAGSLATKLVLSPKFESSMMRIVNTSSEIVKNSAKLIPENGKQVKNAFRLYKSFALTKAIAPTRLLSRNNLFNRYVSRKLNANENTKFLGKIVEKTSTAADKIREAPKKYLKQRKEAKAAAKLAKTKALQEASGTSVKKVSKIGKAVASTKKGLSTVGTKVGTALTPLKNSIQTASTQLNKAVKPLQEGLASAGAKINKSIKPLQEGLASAGAKLNKSIKPLQEGLVSTGRQLNKAVKPLQEGLASAGTKINKAVKPLQEGLGKAKDSIKTAATRTKAGVKAVNSKIGNASAKAIGKVGKQVKKVAKPIAKFAGNALQKTGSAAVKATTKAASKANNLGKSASKAITKGAGKLLGRGAAKALSKAGPIGTVLSVGMAAMDSIDAISNHQDAVKEIKSRDDLTEKEKKQLIRESEDQRNEAIGGAIGSAAGSAIGMAFGGPIGAMVGGFIGEQVGGFIGKSANAIGDFLFGQEEELSEEEQAQLDYEETKFGQVDIADPQLMEKSAMATIAMHDLLISIWHHMNGKASNGEEKSDGLIGSIGKGVGAVASAAGSVIAAPFKAVGSFFGSLFGGGDDKKDEKKNSQGEVTATEEEEKELPEIKEGSFEDVVMNNITAINENVEALLANFNSNKTTTENSTNAINADINQIEGSRRNIKAIGRDASQVSMRKMALTALNPLAPLTIPFMAFNSLFNRGQLRGKNENAAVEPQSLEGNNENVTIAPKPLGEETISVQPDNSTLEKTETTTESLPQTIKLEISGTLRLEGSNGEGRNVDASSIFNSIPTMNKLTDLILSQFNSRGGQGKPNRNTQMYQTQTVSTRNRQF